MWNTKNASLGDRSAEESAGCRVSLLSAPPDPGFGRMGWALVVSLLGFAVLGLGSGRSVWAQEAKPAAADSKPLERAIKDVKKLTQEAKPAADNSKPAELPAELKDKDADSPEANSEGPPSAEWDSVDLEEFLRGLEGPAKTVLTPMLPVLERELHYIRKVCPHTTQQMRHIRQDIRGSLETLAKEMMENRQLQAQLQRQQMMDEGTPYREALPTQLAPLVEKHLGEAAAETYRREIAARVAFQREAISESMLLNLDLKLHLDQEQCEKLPEVIREKWEPYWNISLQYMLYDQYHPVPSSTVLKKVLTDQQWRLWESMHHQNVRFGMDKVNGLDEMGVNIPFKELAVYPLQQSEK